MKLSEYATKNNISYDAAYKRFIKGQIPNAYQADTGAIFIEEEDTSWKDELIKLQQEKIDKLQKSISINISEKIKQKDNINAKWKEVEEIASNNDFDITTDNVEEEKNCMFSDCKNDKLDELIFLRDLQTLIKKRINNLKG